MQENLTAIMKQLKKELDKNRYEHTLGVMFTAASLAMAHDFDINKAMLAGLLHDCAKCIPNDKKIELCDKYNVSLTKLEREKPFLAHAKLGAALAKEIYGIQDVDILHAIAVHTTGEPNMNTIDKIIYIADYIEPGRDKAQNLDRVRNLAFKNMDQTMLCILKDTLGYLHENAGEIDTMTQDTYEYFLKKEELK